MSFCEHTLVFNHTTVASGISKPYVTMQVRACSTNLGKIYYRDIEMNTQSKHYKTRKLRKIEKQTMS